jgi:hypothetical protein
MKPRSSAAGLGSWTTTRCAGASSRVSLLRSIAASEVLADAPEAGPALPGDPFGDRAPRLVDLSVAPVSETHDAAKVAVEFARGDGARERLTYVLVLERGEWRVDDIDYAMLDGQRHTLRDRLAAN